MDGERFTIGEEVVRDGEVYVIAGRREGPYGYRLLAASDTLGRRNEIVWAAESELSEIRTYLDARDDT